MKNVIFVVHSFDESYRGGVLKATSDLANSLVKYNYNVKILSLGPVSVLAFDLDKKIKLESLNMHKYSTQFYTGIKKILWFLYSYKKLNFYIKDNREFLFILTSPPLNMLFSLLKLNFKSTVMIGCDHTSAFYKSTGLLGRFKWYLYKRIDCFVALTEKDNDFYKNNGLKTIWIPNFINFSSLKQYENNKKLFLLFVGRFSDEKRPLLALEAFRKSKLIEKGIKLRMFGDGDLYQLIQSYINNYKLYDSVEIISNVSDTDLIYKDAYGLIMTSSVEGFGMVLIEAISRNIPCVAFDVPSGPGSIIRNGINGFLVQESDIAKFSKCINEIGNVKFNDIQYSISDFDEKVVILKWLTLLNSFESKCV